jgi:hypothetical protein
MGGSGTFCADATWKEAVWSTSKTVTQSTTMPFKETVSYCRTDFPMIGHPPPLI